MKEGLSLSFSTVMFQTWIKEKGIGHISSSLRKKALDGRLLVSVSLINILCATNLSVEIVVPNVGVSHSLVVIVTAT